MAAPKTQSTLAAAAAKSQSLLLLALSLFIFLLLLLNPTTMNSPNVTPPIPFKRLLLHASSINFDPKQTRNPPSSPEEFGAEAHEVPSGPNPISNR
ncbi:hypothetical protein V6N12_014205 [Hibiscus sabdariffa]|uniref:Uncharacterized protein n=1 Tax=Hibiscus sabdariffa TaxID=183260 RepID=A0ABR2DJH0_9ROSI